MKTHINPSSLGSYFGVGFNTPEDQFLIDLGEKEQEFDEEAKSRLRLGRMLEDASLNYFEETFNVIIDNRNTNNISLYNDKIIGKVDGACVLNDIPTVVENKISNAVGYKFTENLGYHIQCQSYMIDNDWQQALLCGLYQGKPVYKIIPRNEEMIADIKEMTDFVVDCLMGLRDFNTDYPKHLYEKYSHQVVLEPLVINDKTRNLIDRLIFLKEKVSLVDEFEKEIKQIEDTLKDNYGDGFIKTDTHQLTISSASRSGSLDMDALMLDYPQIDLTKYKTPSTTYKKIILKSLTKSKK